MFYLKKISSISRTVKSTNLQHQRREKACRESVLHHYHVNRHTSIVVCVCVCVCVWETLENRVTVLVISILNPTQAQDLTNTHFWIFTYMILTSWFDEMSLMMNRIPALARFYFPEASKRLKILFASGA